MTPRQPMPLTNFDDIMRVASQVEPDDSDRTWQPWRLELLRQHIRTGKFKITESVMKRVRKHPKIRQLIIEEVALRTIIKG